MQNPLQTELPAFLTNFSFENEHDQLLWQMVDEKRAFDWQFIQGMSKLLASVESETHHPGYTGALQESRDYYMRNWLAAQIRVVELERFVAALDIKMCQLAAHVLEPFPGFFAQVGISRVYKAFLVSQENQEKQRADLKAKLSVIKGGQE